MKYKNLFSTNKLDYITGKSKPKVKCILCSVALGDNNVKSLEVYRDLNFIISVNLYPFNVGHLLIFPIKHVEHIKELNSNEASELHRLTCEAIDILNEIYTPGGFNVGFNIGPCSGASINHLHLHIVPRYERELGVIDIIGGVKLIVEDPEVTTSKLREAFQKRKLAS